MPNPNPTSEPVNPKPVACTHPLVELLSVNGRNLDGAVRRCAFCRAEVRS